MTQREMLITRKDLLKFMSLEKYEGFIKYLVNKTRKKNDYEPMKDTDALWIIAEWDGINGT